MYYTEFPTRFWPVVLVGDADGISHLHMETNEGKRTFAISTDWKRDDALFADVRQQVQAYVDGSLRAFDVKLNLQGTPFQQRVWDALLTIPYGEIRTYKDIAVSIGKPSAARAVGMANGKNPIPLIVPCHRVIGQQGSLAGFAHGVAAKKQLLVLEGALDAVEEVLPLFRDGV